MANRLTPKRLEAFDATLRSLGTNDADRGRVIGLSGRGVQDMRYGKLSKVLQSLMREPKLLVALAQDAERLNNIEDGNASGGVGRTKKSCQWAYAGRSPGKGSDDE